MKCRRDREHEPHVWGYDGEKVCPGVPPTLADNLVVDALEHVLFRVAMLRDLTVLSEKDRRALDQAYRNLDGVKKRREGAA